jgi:hypothetical protein
MMNKKITIFEKVSHLQYIVLGDRKINGFHGPHMEFLEFKIQKIQMLPLDFRMALERQ